MASPDEAALGEPSPSGDGPVEDRRQFGSQPRDETAVFAAEKAVRQHEHDESAGEGAAGIGRARQLVG
jgi:hypothetical protein